MTAAEYLTHQFYAWDYRGQGWHLENVPVHLEPPFMPFIRHVPKTEYIDDGKRHTLVSYAIELLKGKKNPVQEDEPALDYEEMEMFPFEDDSGLVASQVKMPKERKITPERMKELVIMLSTGTSPISFEIIGNASEIIIQFVCRAGVSYMVESTIKAYFPDMTVVQNNASLTKIFDIEKPVYVTDLGLGEEFVRPLPASKNFAIDPLTAMFGALERLDDGQNGCMQILFCPAVNSWANSIIHSVTMADGSSFFGDEPDSPKLAIEKTASPLFAVCIRVLGQGATLEESERVFESICYPLLQASRGHSNCLIPLPHETYDVDARLADIWYRWSHRLGMLLNADELVHLLHFPSESIYSRKLFSGNRKTKQVPAIAKGKPFVIGINEHNGTETNVTFGIDERLKHTHIIGATGTGKSTLIANLIVQDCQKGLGLVLFDPHGDLVDDVITQIPENRIRDVVLIDPSDNEYPIGLNILEAHNDIEKEILSSDLVASFRRLSTSWGDQMNAVFGNAILAMLESNEGGTLHDLRRFLIEKEYRDNFLKAVQDPSVLYYWHKVYPLLKTNSIGPIVTRLDSFLRPRTIRNIVIQKTGLDLEELINSNKIILVKLSQGLIGAENSFLLGSLILSKIHQAAFARQRKAIRNPFFIYLDEFQNFITPSIKEMLSGVRKYNVGLALSHQDLQQLQREDGELLNSVLGNTYTRIVFRVGEPDARKLEQGFSSFDVADLQNLGRGEALVRIEQPQFDCSLDTVPLPDAAKDIFTERMQSVTAHSRSLYAKERSEVEQLLADTLSFDIPEKEIPVVKKEIEKKDVQQAAPVKQDAQKPKKEVAITSADNKEPVADQDMSTHRYLQTLVKKMAEARGYIATLEVATPNQDGSVDVLLTKEATTIAVEICSTTEAEWEMHNIDKCINAGYTSIVSICSDAKQLEKIKQKCIAGITAIDLQKVHFFTPEAFFSYLNTVNISASPTEATIKGYRVQVSYDAMTDDEMNKKRASVANVVVNSIKKIKKK